MKNWMRKVSNQKRRQRVRESQRRLAIQELELRKLLAADSFEPNNTFGTARDLGSSTSTYSLTIEPAGDVDVFRWRAPGNGVVRFDALFSQSQGDLDLRLYDSAFNQIDASVSLDDNERVRATVSQNQELYIKVSEFSGTQVVPYGFKATFIQPDAIDASALNNSLSTATNLGTGNKSLSNLNIHNSSDVDYFRWTATISGQLKVDATFLHAEGNLNVSVMDLSGTELTSSSSQTNNEQALLNVTAGSSYIVKVYEANGLEQPRYDLNLSFGSPPTISDIPLTLGSIGGTTLVNFTVSDPDTPLNSLIISGSSSDQFLVPNSNISFTGTGASRTAIIKSPGGFGFLTITITATDPTGASSSESFDLGLFLSNASPVISTISDITVAENASSGIINFTVSDGQTPANQLVVTATSSNTALIPNSNIILGGTDSNRTIRVTPLPNQIGTTTITVRVQDTDNATATETFLVSVFDTANVPRISPIDDVTINEDTSTGPIPFILSDADTSPTFLSVTAGSSNPAVVPISGIVLSGSGANRTVSVTPVTNASGSSTVSLTVSDGSASSTETFVVTVVLINDLPTISVIPDSTIPENTSMPATPFTVFDEETPANSLTVTASSSNTFMVPNDRIILAGSGTNRSVTVVPVADRQGSAVITLTVSDGTGGTASRSFTLTVSGDDDAPTISPIPDQTIMAGKTSNVAFTISDDTQPSSGLFVTAFSSNQSIIADDHLIISGTGDNRSLAITPNAAGGPVTISIVVSDGSNNTTEQFDVVVGTNGPTISSIADQVVNEDGSTGPLAFVVADPDTPVASLTITAVSNNQTLVPNANIVLGGSGSNRTVTVTPAANVSGGPATITLTVSDGSSTAIETFNVTVTSVNDSPTISQIADQTVGEGISTGPLAFTLSDPDTPLDSLTVAAASNNQLIIPNGNIVLGGSGANRTVTVTPAPQTFGGPITITITVGDGTSTVIETFNVTVTASNKVPTISAIADQVINEDAPTGPIAFTVADGDTPLDSLTITATSNNQTLVPNGNIILAGTGANRTVNVSPAPNANGGPAIITVTVSDGANTATETFNVTVTPFNDPPTISAIADQVINEDTSTGPLAFTLADPDTALNSLTITATSSNQTLVPNANIVLAGSGASRTVNVTPVANGNGGPALITLTVSDGSSSVTETFNVTVTAINDGPTISTIADQVINEDNATGPLAFTVADPDNALDTLTITATSSNQTLVPNGNIVLAGTGANRTVNITPASNVTGGPAVITLTVSDGTSSATTTFNLTVTAVNDGPTISPIADEVIQENSSTGALAFTLADPDTALTALTVTAASNNQTLIPNSNVVLGGSGANRTVTVTPVANASGGPVLITLTVSDGTNSAVETFSVTVMSASGRVIGDSNGDGVFDSSDFVFVLAAGEYEDNIPGNSTWEEGDWNEDGDFDSSDLVFALQAGTYQEDAAASPAVETNNGAGQTSGSGTQLDGNLVDIAIATNDAASRDDDLLYRWVKRALS